MPIQPSTVRPRRTPRDTSAGAEPVESGNTESVESSSPDSTSTDGAASGGDAGSSGGDDGSGGGQNGDTADTTPKTQAPRTRLAKRRPIRWPATSSRTLISIRCSRRLPSNQRPKPPAPVAAMLQPKRRQIAPPVMATTATMAVEAATEAVATAEMAATPIRRTATERAATVRCKRSPATRAPALMMAIVVRPSSRRPQSRTEMTSRLRPQPRLMKAMTPGQVVAPKSRRMPTSTTTAMSAFSNRRDRAQGCQERGPKERQEQRQQQQWQ